MATVWSILVIIDGAIYDLICYVYEIFYYLATLNIFKEEHYQGIVNRIYVILGIFMLFVLAYSLLRAIINPDEFSKDDQSFPNLIKNVLVSLVIIILLPTVFSVAFNIQNTILNNDTIPKLVLGVDEATKDNSQGGRTIAYYLYKAFLYPNSDYCGDMSLDDCRDSIKGNGWLFVTNGDKLTVMDEAVMNGSSFRNYNDYSESIRDGKLSYLFPISTVAGVFTLYVLLNFCFDMAIRVVKLAFYQIIAPIPVICRIIPGKSMKDVFDKWVKQIISIFLEVFIRIAVLAICIYLINIVVDAYNTGLPGIGTLSWTQRPIVLALIIMGIVIFMKQAPQILGDLLNLKTDGMKLGLMDKLAMGGGLLAGAAAGGGVISGFKNFNMARANGAGRLSAFKSAIAGAGSGAVRAGYNAKGAKNFKDMLGATSKGVTGATTKKAKRDAYKASHSNETIFGRNIGAIPLVGGTLSVGAGHAKDFGNKVKETLGFSSGLAELQQEQSIYQEGMGFKKDLFDLVSDNESVMAYQGLKKSAQERDLSDYTDFYDLNASGDVFDKRTGAVLHDQSGNTFKNAEAAAIFSKTQEIEKYDTAIKLASMRAIHKKLESKDGRFLAQFDKFETWKKQHSNNDLVSSLTMSDIDTSQLDMINQALNSNDYSAISSAKESLESSVGSIMYNDRKFKEENGNITAKIAKIVQDKKEQEGK